MKLPKQNEVQRFQFHRTMKTSVLRSYFSFQHFTTTSANSPSLIAIRASSQPQLKQSRTISATNVITSGKTLPCQTKVSLVEKQFATRTQKPSEEEFQLVVQDGNSRYVIIGAVSIGLVLLLMSIDDQKAMALGPEGPLMEEFWDNVRRYALYFLTVSTGALYAIFQPIYELLKNPISAILILTILGGGFFIVSQVVSAMVGISDFNYEYQY